MAGPVGALCHGLPSYAMNPPIEAVVFSWGVSEDGQLGLDGNSNVASPKVVEALLGVRFRGRDFMRCPLVGGSRNTLAIDADGHVWAFGWNDRGTLGHGHRSPERKPRRIMEMKDTRIMQVAIGGWHCLALSEEGRMFAWGGNEYLQCGVEPDKRDVVSPTACLPQLKVTQVACGGMHSLALTEAGQVWMWGEPWGNFAINIQREPRKVEGADDVGAIACGAFHNLALTRDGQVLSWGINDYGQLGNGSTDYQTTPETVVDLEDLQIADIAAGGWHSIALTDTGQVYIWGRGEYGRLGIGDRSGSSKLRPQLVKGLEGHRIVQAAAGGTHTVVLTSTGRMFIWGRGSYGRLGLGSEKDWYQPVECQLPGGHARWRVLAVAAGGRHTMCLALPVSHSLSAWKPQDVAEGDEGQEEEAEEEEEEEGEGHWALAASLTRYRSDLSGVEGGSEQSSEELTYEQRLALAEAGGPEVQEVHAMADEVETLGPEAEGRSPEGEEEEEEENQGTMHEEEQLLLDGRLHLEATTSDGSTAHMFSSGHPPNSIHTKLL